MWRALLGAFAEIANVLLKVLRDIVAAQKRFALA